MESPGRTLLTCALAVAPLLPFTPAAAQELDTDHHEVRTRAVVEGLEHPWGLEFLPDGRFLVTERNPGHVRIGTRDGDLSQPLEGVPEIFRYEGETGRSQGGLFDVRLHPDFEENRLVYLSFSKPTDRGAAVAVVRGRLEEEEDAARLEDVEEVFEMKPDDQDSSGLHFGGRMVFDPEEEALYLSIGERRNISRSQAPTDQAGSILRMTYDGDPAPGNPFLDGEDGDPYVFAVGLRNPQGLEIEPGAGRLWVVDHGPRGGDEVNLVEAGRNYGWPLYTDGADYSGAPLGHEDPPEEVVGPVHVFQETVAPSGLTFYTGPLFPQWEGDLLIGGLAAEALIRLRVQDGSVVEQERIEVGRRVRDVAIGPDGAVWIATEHADGEVLRLVSELSSR